MHEEQTAEEIKITKWIKIAIILYYLSSCVHNETNNNSKTFNKKLLLGEIVHICGKKIDSANFKISNADYYKSLYAISIVDPGSTSPNERRAICITGELIYLGCETDENVICVDAAFDYGIRITDFKLDTP